MIVQCIAVILHIVRCVFNISLHDVSGVVPSSFLTSLNIFSFSFSMFLTALGNWFRSFWLLLDYGFRSGVVEVVALLGPCVALVGSCYQRSLDCLTLDDTDKLPRKVSDELPTTSIVHHPRRAKTPWNVSICMLITSSLGHMEWSRVRSLLITNTEYKNSKKLVPVRIISRVFNQQKLS